MRNLYNESQIRTRNVVERSYGVWKRRFPILSLGIRLDIERVEAIVVATAVLHNIATDHNDQLPVSEIEGFEEMLADMALDETNLEDADDGDTRTHIRDVLVNRYFANLD